MIHWLQCSGRWEQKNLKCLFDRGVYETVNLRRHRTKHIESDSLWRYEAASATDAPVPSGAVCCRRWREGWTERADISIGPGREHLSVIQSMFIPLCPSCRPRRTFHFSFNVSAFVSICLQQLLPTDNGPRYRLMDAH